MLSLDGGRDLAAFFKIRQICSLSGGIDPPLDALPLILSHAVALGAAGAVSADIVLVVIVAISFRHYTRR